MVSERHVFIIFLKKNLEIEQFLGLSNGHAIFFNEFKSLLLIIFPYMVYSC